MKITADLPHYFTSNMNCVEQRSKQETTKHLANSLTNTKHNKNRTFCTRTKITFHHADSRRVVLVVKSGVDGSRVTLIEQ
jgi:methylphosphotriester-DNA--protein-cysteine methyltransferase